MTGPVFDHDLPRSTFDRLGDLVELLTDIRDRLPAPDKGGQPAPAEGSVEVKLREPKPVPETPPPETTAPEAKAEPVEVKAKPAKKAASSRRRAGG